MPDVPIPEEELMAPERGNIDSPHGPQGKAGGSVLRSRNEKRQPGLS